MKKQHRHVLMICLCAMLCIAGFYQAPKALAATTLSKPKISTVSRTGKGKVTVKWNKISGATGYELQYAENNSYKSAKTSTITKNATVSKTLSSISTSKDTYFHVRAYKTVNGVKTYSSWSATARLVVWKTKWTYAKNSKIHSDPAVLYYSYASKKKNKTVCINAGHGCKGGSSKKTLCHPNGSKKVTGGSTGSGAKYATAINEGCTLKKMSEAAANLKIAMKLKTKLLAAGYNVLMIRETSDRQLDNVARTVMANNVADCHISIHFDSTSSNKGAFFCSVPDVKSYRNMTPVKDHYKQHISLGKNLISGLKSAKVKIYKKGSIELDLTQTSYSTIPSVDLEVGDKSTSTSDKNLNKIANGILAGVKKYLK